MGGEILLSMLSGIGAFFIHPLLYIGLVIIGLTGWRRMKRERQHFYTRVYGARADFIIPFFPALLAGGILSVMTILLGITVTLSLLGVFSLSYLLLALTTKVRLLSPAYAGGLTLLLLLLAPYFQTGVSLIDDTLASAATVPLIHVAVLTILLIMAEGDLIQRYGATYTSPKLMVSKRGKWIGVHEAKRVWILPVVLFLPEGAIPAFEFWPVFSMGEGTYQPLLVPFLIGFQQQIQSSLPKAPIKLMGRRVIGFAFILAVLAAAAFYVPVLFLVIACAAILGRELLWVLAKLRDEAAPAVFAQRSQGCMILGVLPDSPANKMGLKVGEVILKVNGQPVNNEVGFYEALQINSAFCKIEVVDEHGEIRFVQGALYDGEHHQLGVLLVKEEYELQDSVV
ncbi:PDZ domain-containing protein [Halalkalibacterium ligniniphilum]|uniref:PDZ domain-containing protein n=1 Tax=Halalkalibacterium ligniniphilum TaxID=1134413 RepID=UPI00034AE2FB|nr:PDZ domain-containing protein [Halalkalibacterium ligniniphilum]